MKKFSIHSARNFAILFLVIFNSIATAFAQQGVTSAVFPKPRIVEDKNGDGFIDNDDPSYNHCQPTAEYDGHYLGYGTICTNSIGLATTEAPNQNKCYHWYFSEFNPQAPNAVGPTIFSYSCTGSYFASTPQKQCYPVNLPHRGLYRIFLVIDDIVSGTCVPDPQFISYDAILAYDGPPASSDFIITKTSCSSVCLNTQYTPLFNNNNNDQAINVDFGDGSDQVDWFAGLPFAGTCLSHNYALPGNYTVTVTVKTSCTYDPNLQENPGISFTYPIYISNNPQIKVAGPPAVCDGGSAILQATSNLVGNYSYNWSTGENTIAINVSPSVTTGYSVTVTDNTNQCTVSASSVLTILENCCVTSLPADIIIDQTKLSDYITLNPNLFVVSQGTYRVNTAIFNPAVNNLYFNGNNVIDLSLNLSGITVRMGEQAELYVAPGATLTIDNCDIGPCENMWSGIRINNNSASISIVNNSRIWQAMCAVSASYDAPILIENSIFENNNVGIFLSTYNGAIAPVNVNNTKFRSQPNQLRFPLLGKTSLYGIWAIGVNQLNLDDQDISNDIQNEFSGLQTGVFIASSNVLVRGNHFENIHDFDGLKNASSGCAIYAYNGLGVPRYNLEVHTISGIPSSISPIQFLNCDKGIVSGFDYSLNCYHNTFSDITKTAVEVLNTNSSNTVSISNNYLANVYSGIHVNSLSGSDLFVSDNTIFAGAPKKCWGCSQPYGISIENTKYNTIHEHQIRGNTIYDGLQGIRLNGTQNYIHLEDNHVFKTKAQLAGWPRPSGISIENSTRFDLIANDFHGNYVPGVYQILGSGIYLLRSQDYTMSCNEVNNFQYGLHFQGNCDPKYYWRIRENKVTNGNIGLLLARVAGTDVGYIGKEVGSEKKLANNNNFEGNFSSGNKAYNVTSSGMQAFVPKIYYQPFDPISGNIAHTLFDDLQFNPAPSNSNYGPSLAIQNWPCDNHSAVWSNTLGCGINSNGMVLPHNTGADEEKLLLEQIAEDAIQYPLFQDGVEWIKGLELYKKLEEDPDWKNSSDILNSYFEQEKLGTIGQIREAEKRRDEILAVTPDNLNVLTAFRAEWREKIANINAEGNFFASNIKNLLQIEERFTFTKPLELESHDKIYISDLADQCPYLYGDAVLQARALRGLFEDGMYYDDAAICANSGYFKTTNEIVDEPLMEKIPSGTLEILSNPVGSHASIRYSLDSAEIGYIHIINLLGQNCMTVNLKGKQGLVTIAIDCLPQGIYTAALTSENGIIKSVQMLKK